jgi:iron complex transport system ATP-binding protein
MLLDKPLQHLDLRHQQQTLRQIRAAAPAGRAAVVVRDLTFAAPCDRALLLSGNGSHAQGAAADMLEPKRLEGLFGCRLAVCGSGATAHVTPVI